MVMVTLADGQQRFFEEALTATALAAQLSRTLVKEAVAVKINGVCRDLSVLIQDDCHVELILSDSIEGLDVLRHSAAHLMAQAVQ